jgi:ankyrin repeat protein
MFYLTNNYNNLVKKLCKSDYDFDINIQYGGKKGKKEKISNNDNENNIKIKFDEDELVILLNNKDWEKIISLYKNPRDIKVNGNNLLHLACTRGEIDAINYYILKYPELFYVANSEGDTCAHLLAKYGYYDILKSLVKKFPEVIHFINKNGDSLLDLTLKEPQIMNFLINLIDSEYFKDMDATKIASLKSMIELIKLNNGKDIYLHMINKLLSKGFQLNQPIPYYPLLVASKFNKPDVVDSLLKHGANPNIRDTNELSPLIKAVENKSYDTVKLLLQNGADINYAGPEGDHLPINIALNNQDDKMVDILLDSKFNNNKLNLSFRNRNLDTPLHIALKNSQNNDYLKESNLIKLVKKSDLTLKNIKNTTSLDLLKEYSKRKNIKIKHLYKPEKNNKREIAKINMPKIKKNNFGLFNSDVLHGAIYTYCILQKYNNLAIPTQKFNLKKFNKEFDNFNFLINYRTQEGSIIKDLVSVYYDSLYEMMPYLILWRSRDIYYCNENLKKSLKKLLNDNKVEFIYIKLSLIPNGNSTHANLLLYNKKKNILERFEPYGYNEMLDEEKLNQFIEKLAKKIFNKDVKYINPKHFMDNAKFQIISSDSDPDNKKLGDPIGYCLAWTFWYLELRLNNPETDSKLLVENALNKIINKQSDSNQVLDYIRNYSQELDKLKNNFLKDCGIEKDDYYNNNFDDKDLEVILDKLKM